MVNHQITLISTIDPQSDPIGYLGFVRNPNDGSIIRKEIAAPATPISSYESNPRLLVKDIPINHSKNTYARVFLPKQAIGNIQAGGKKLPVLIFMHGGGFVILNVNHPNFDRFYDDMTTHVPAVIVAVEYRRAPEHRLPAAYEDGVEALHWIKNCPDEWLTKYADFSNAFVMGSSAGSNLVYHLSLRVSSIAHQLHPLKIKGVILHQTFLGGTERTGSELRNVNDKILPPCITDVMWELALPVGADRDHEFSNPVLSIKPGQFDEIKSLGWSFLATGYQGDGLYDRQVELAKVLEENGLNIMAEFQEGGFHGSDAVDPAKLQSLVNVVKEFVKLHSN